MYCPRCGSSAYIGFLNSTIECTNPRCPYFMPSKSIPAPIVYGSNKPTQVRGAVSKNLIAVYSDKGFSLPDGTVIPHGTWLPILKELKKRGVSTVANYRGKDWTLNEIAEKCLSEPNLNEWLNC